MSSRSRLRQGFPITTGAQQPHSVNSTVAARSRSSILQREKPVGRLPLNGAPARSDTDTGRGRRAQASIPKCGNKIAIWAAATAPTMRAPRGGTVGRRGHHAAARDSVSHAGRRRAAVRGVTTPTSRSTWTSPSFSASAIKRSENRSRLSARNVTVPRRWRWAIRSACDRRERATTGRPRAPRPVGKAKATGQCPCRRHGTTSPAAGTRSGASYSETAPQARVAVGDPFWCRVMVDSRLLFPADSVSILSSCRLRSSRWRPGRRCSGRPRRRSRRARRSAPQGPC